MRKRVVVLTVAVALCVAAAVFAVTRDETVLVKTVTVSARSVEKTVSCDGITEAGETKPIFLQTGCMIQSVEAKEGMFINEGDVIVTVDKDASKTSGQLSRRELLTLSTMEEEVCALQSGILLKVNAREGEWLALEEPAAVIAPSDKIRVRIAIREKHLPSLQIGQAVTVSGDGLCADSYNGTLTEISSTAQRAENGGTFVEGVVELDDVSDKDLRIGINVECKIVVDTVTDCVVIPYEAVSQRDNDTGHLYVLQDGQAVKHKIVEEDELSDGIVVRDTELVGKQIVLQPDAITEERRRTYVSAEGQE